MLCGRGGGCWATAEEAKPGCRLGRSGNRVGGAAQPFGRPGHGGGPALDLAAGGPGRASGAGLPLVHRTAGSTLSGGGPPGRRGLGAERRHGGLGPGGGPGRAGGGAGRPEAQPPRRGGAGRALALRRGRLGRVAPRGHGGRLGHGARGVGGVDRGPRQLPSCRPQQSHLHPPLGPRAASGRPGRGDPHSASLRKHLHVKAGPRRPHLLACPVHTLSYKEESYHSASRSGHCAALLPTPGPRPGHQLLLVGGCSSAEPEVAGHWSYGKIKEELPVAPRLMEQLAKLVSSGQGSPQGPRGLRHHSCSVVGPFAVLFGGETLTRARDTVCNDLYVCDARTSPSLWFRFPCADRALKRVGHRTCLWNDQLYLVGGFGEDGRTASPQVCTLDLFI